MKLGILTHYQAESHGACLQHYALTQYLRAMGHEVHTLTYTRDFTFSSAGDRAKFSVGLRSVPYYCKEYLWKHGPSYVWTMAKKHLILRRFNRTHFSFLPHTHQNLDAVIIGSDEVWSLQTGFNAVMFGHGLSCENLIAYAPSFGQTTMTDIQARGRLDAVRMGLSQFCAVSARDTNTRALTEHLTGRCPSMVCDPALLYSFDRELEALPKRKAPTYIAVYAYNSDLNEAAQVDAIRAYARSIDAQVYAVGGYHRWCDNQIACDPLELLAWFRDAAAVVTDTFHGTIGAYLTNTPMAVYPRSTNRNKLSHLLSVLQLENRAVAKDRQLSDVLAAPMDFDVLHAALQSFRTDSETWLNSALTALNHREGDLN